MTLYQVLPLIQGAITIALVILVLQRGVKNTATRLFAFFLVGMSLMGVFIGIMRLMPPESAVLWEKLALTMIGFSGVFFYLFTGEFINSRSPWGILLCALYLLVTMVIMPTSLVVEGMATDVYGNAPLWGVSFYPWLSVTYILIVISMFKLNRARRVSTSYEERNRYLFFIIGVGFCLLGGVLDILPALGVPVFPGSILGNIMFASLTAWAILRYQLFDIRVMMRLSIAYVITGIFVLLPLGGLMALWIWASEYWQLSLYRTFLPLLLLLLLAPQIWKRATPIATSLVLRERYGHLKSLDEFSNISVKPDDPAELYSSLVTLTKSAVNPIFVSLFVRTDDDSLKLERWLGAQREVNFYIPRDHQLVYWFEKEKVMLWRLQIDTEPMLQTMTDRDRSLLDQIGGDLYCPMGIAGLLGIMILGPKSHGQVYSRDDINFLHTLVRQASLELENIGFFNRERAHRKRLEQFNKERAAFLDTLAHELKTPLTSAISSSELLVHETKESTDSIRPLSLDVWSSVKDLDRLVSDILDFGDSQDTKVKFLTERVDLCQLGLSMKDEYAILLSARRQKLVVTLPDSPLWVNIDPARMRQVIRNLIDNASKFSPSGSKLYLRMTELDRSIKIEMQDSADPIDPEEQEDIFTPYYRGLKAQIRRVPGLGLGLYMSRKLVEEQGGKMWLVKGEQTGNIFRITLPKEGMMS